MMIKRNVLSCFLLLLTMMLSAQVKMRDVFKQMPSTVVPYLNDNSKLDFIDFIDSGMKAEVTNALNGKSVMQQLTDDYLRLSLNEASELTMRLLPVSEQVDSTNQVVCMVRTYGTDIQESVIAFYSVNWRRLPLDDYLSLPKGMWVATLNENEAELTLTSDNRLDAPVNEEQKVFAEKTIILKWIGKFVNK